MDTPDLKRAEPPATDSAAFQILTLHRDRSRHAYFDQRPWPAPFFDKTIDSSVVVDPSDCEAILRLPGLRPGTDPICDCWRNTATVLLSAYTGANQKGSRGGREARCGLAVRSIVFPDVDTHNLILALANSGRLDAFFDRIFQFHKDPPERKSPHPERNRISRLLPWSTNALEAAPGPSRRRLKNKP